MISRWVSVAAHLHLASVILVLPEIHAEAQFPARLEILVQATEADRTVIVVQRASAIGLSAAAPVDVVASEAVAICHRRCLLSVEAHLSKIAPASFSFAAGQRDSTSLDQAAPWE